jgi:hypothetical protein
MTRIIYCSDPLRPSYVDEPFAREAAAANAVGLNHSLINFEALVAGDSQAAVRRVPTGDALGIYRGWMLTSLQYTALHDALHARGIRLINSPAQYQYAHHFPENYSDIAALSPQSVCIPLKELNWPTLSESLRGFGDRPLLLKDWVKSRKHEWDEACFIPSAADAVAVERVARRFVELQAEDLTGGLVFRLFETFEPLGTHARSGMPLTKEFRLFYLDGGLLACAHYWEDADYSGAGPPFDLFNELAQKLRSRFFSLDVAQRTDGAWRVIEMGDGQVSGLPEDLDPTDFYRTLAIRIAE